MTVIGLPVLVLGARLLVDGSVAIAHRLEIPETVIGLTVVAVGTSLPELVTSAIAAFRGQADLAVGNVLGSNIFNILGILGITATIVPLPPDEQIQALDIWVMAGSAALLVVLLFTGQKLSRLEGAALLGGYGIYLFALL